jgi:hypothetical protein
LPRFGKHERTEFILHTYPTITGLLTVATLMACLVSAHRATQPPSCANVQGIRTTANELALAASREYDLSRFGLSFRPWPFESPNAM